MLRVNFGVENVCQQVVLQYQRAEKEKQENRLQMHETCHLEQSLFLKYIVSHPIQCHCHRIFFLMKDNPLLKK